MMAVIDVPAQAQAPSVYVLKGYDYDQPYSEVYKWAEDPT